MENIIIRKEWIEILERQSTHFRDTVMGAIFNFALRGVEPTDLDPMAMLAYEFIKTEMLRVDESLDFDAATEAAIKKKRADQRRAERAAQRAAERTSKQENEQNLPYPKTDAKASSLPGSVFGKRTPFSGKSR